MLPRVAWPAASAIYQLTNGPEQGAENLAAQVSMIGILAAMIFMSLLMIISFDHPFTGPVRIEPEALEDLLKRFASS